MQRDHASIARTIRWSCRMRSSSWSSRPWSCVSTRAPPNTCSVAVARAAAELREVARVDRLGERRALVVAPQRAVVGLAVRRAERQADARVRVAVGAAAAPQRADAVAELLQEVLVAEAAAARGRRRAGRTGRPARTRSPRACMQSRMAASTRLWRAMIPAWSKPSWSSTSAGGRSAGAGSSLPQPATAIAAAKATSGDQACAWVSSRIDESIRCRRAAPPRARARRRAARDRSRTAGR